MSSYYTLVMFPRALYSGLYKTDTLSAVGALSYPLWRENETDQEIHKWEVGDVLTAMSEQ